MKINAIQKQWPVGQGGFATGEVTFYGELTSTLSYIYDCGSDSLAPLREAIYDFLVDWEEIDIAFLSHLDSDHVNGIDTLLGKCAVRNVDTALSG
jgi:phosphoribosyl 1,2-cyclic phosphodiesterase